eukprot:1550879-Prymnesium_polylepis.1
MGATSARCAPAAADGARCHVESASTSRTRPRLTTAESSDSDAVTCESMGGTLGSRGISAVYGTCTP